MTTLLATPPRPLNFISRLIFNSPRTLFIVAVWAIVVVKSGFGIFNLELLAQLAENPFTNPITEPHLHFLFWSWLTPFLMWTLGIATPTGVLCFFIFFSIAFTLLFILTAWRFLPDHLARISFLIFAAMPTSGTVYFLICTDSLTLFLMMAALIFPDYKNQKNLIFVFIIAVLLGMQDFEKIVLAAGALFLGTYLTQRYIKENDFEFKYTPTFALTLVFGAVMGKLVLMGIFSYFEIVVNSGRFFWLQNYLYRVVPVFFYKIQESFYSCLGMAWLVAFYVVFNEKYGKFFGLALLCCFLVLIIAMDHTRVFALISLPLMAQFILFNQNLLSKITKPWAALFCCLWLIAPFVWILVETHFTMTSHNIFALLINFFDFDFFVPN